MTPDLKVKVEKIDSLLTAEQKNKEILEVQNISENQPIIDYLESIGEEDTKYLIPTIAQPERIKETGGIAHLWYKGKEGNWVIRLWQIDRID
jgi:hypothetical protein